MIVKRKDFKFIIESSSCDASSKIISALFHLYSGNCLNTCVTVWNRWSWGTHNSYSYLVPREYDRKWLCYCSMVFYGWNVRTLLSFFSESRINIAFTCKYCDCYFLIGFWIVQHMYRMSDCQNIKKVSSSFGIAIDGYLFGQFTYCWCLHKRW